MLVDIVMPKMGESIMDGKILKWYKKAGDSINKDETLLEISTDKVDTEIPCSDAGIVVELLYNEGDVANVGDVIARIETDASTAKIVEKKEKTPDVTKAVIEKPIEQPKTETKEPQKDIETKTSGTGFYTPLVLNIASKEGISMNELSSIIGTGAGGRVRKQDIFEYVANKKSGKISIKPAIAKSTETPAFSGDMTGVKIIPMDNIQSKMADHMVESVHTSPHVGAISECDMSAIENAKKTLEKDFLAKEGFKLTYMPFVCEAVVKAIKDFPLVNSSIDGKNILMKKNINLGIAVALDNGGLIVPVVKNADSKNMTGIARDINDLAKRARTKKLTLEEIQDGTFTITNYGVFGNIIGTPIINQPQIAILGTGAVKKRAVVIETEHGDSITIKPMMYLTLSFDHRLIDGALGGKFLMKIVEYLENYKI